jgi:hypothetical protein
MIEIPLEPLKERSMADATIRRTSPRRDWILILSNGKRYRLPKTHTFTPEAAAAYARMLFGEAEESKGG